MIGLVYWGHVNSQSSQIEIRSTTLRVIFLVAPVVEARRSGELSGRGALHVFEKHALLEQVRDRGHPA
jgi:hypothetical protein